MYETKDVLSAIGGITALIGGFMSSFAAIQVAIYMYSMADMIKRKAKHRINKIILKRNIEKVPDIEAAIEELQEKTRNGNGPTITAITNNGDDKSKDKGKDKKEIIISPEQELENDLIECGGIVGMEANTYTLVQEKVDVLIRLRDKYLPNDAED